MNLSWYSSQQATLKFSGLKQITVLMSSGCVGWRGSTGLAGSSLVSGHRLSVGAVREQLGCDHRRPGCPRWQLGAPPHGLSPAVWPWLRQWQLRTPRAGGNDQSSRGLVRIWPSVSSAEFCWSKRPQGSLDTRVGEGTHSVRWWCICAGMATAVFGGELPPKQGAAATPRAPEQPSLEGLFL